MLIGRCQSIVKLFVFCRRMEAQFIRYENIADGNHVQPGTKQVKRWLMKNTGNYVWTSGTKVMNESPPIILDSHFAYACWDKDSRGVLISTYMGENVAPAEFARSCLEIFNLWKQLSKKRL